jgi:hypothetical protein
VPAGLSGADRPQQQRVLASTGDERNALLMLTVEGDLGGGR